MEKNIIISIREVEPGLVRAVQRLAKHLDVDIQGIVLIDKKFVNDADRVRDESNFFQEIICDFDDPDELQKVIKPIQDRILSVTCRFETAIRDFRKLIPFLPYVNTPNETALNWCTEKHLMRDRLRSYDENLTPRYIDLIEYNETEVINATADFKFPVIVKPAGLYSSLLVNECADQVELLDTLQKSFASIKDIYSREHGTGIPRLLVEEMMEGQIYSIDAYVDQHGKIYCLPTVKVDTAKSMGKPGFYTYSTATPSMINSEQEAMAQTAAEASIKALNLNSTTAHIEMIATEQGWKIIELGPRIGGHREIIYREAYGVDHYYNDLCVRIGLTPEIPVASAYSKHVAGALFYAENEGIISDVTSLEPIKELNSTVMLNQFLSAGDTAKYAGNGGEPVVDAIFANESLEQLTADVEYARQNIEITIQ